MSLRIVKTLLRKVIIPRQLASLHLASSQRASDKTEEKTPLGRFSEEEKKKDGEAEGKKNDPYAPFPDAVNPQTGEIGGPLGPEPTRYGDWERKGRVTDF